MNVLLLFILFACLSSARAECINPNPLDPTSTAVVSDNGYNSWKLSAGVNYNHQIYVPTASDPCVGISFHWSILGSSIQIAVASFIGTNLVESGGWVGLGFSETGGMSGADIVYYETSTNSLVDAHVLDGNAKPIRDSQQDWALINATISEDGYLIFEAQRLLDTGDRDDWPFVDDSHVYVSDHRMISAWGSSSSIRYHGNNRAKSIVQLFSSDTQPAGDGYLVFQKHMQEQATGTMMLALEDYTLPTQRTTYHRECYSYNDLTSSLIGVPTSDIYIIGVEVVYPEEAAKYFHHMLAYGSTTSINPNPDTCSYVSFPWYGWAPGQDYMHLPDGTGFKFSNSDPTAFNALEIEYHWDNRDSDSGITLSGVVVQIYYTTETVENELGLVTTGDPLLQLEDETLGNGPVRFDFECPGRCSQNNIPEAGITIVQEGHHMHEKGKRMTSEVIRDGKVIHRAVTDYWDFEQSGLNLVRQEPYTVKRGDSFSVTCYYDSNENTVFGLGSQDEMCMNFIWYYPKIPNFAVCGPGVPWYLSCNGSFEQKSLSEDTEYNRIFGTDSNVGGDDDHDDDSTPSSGTIVMKRYWTICLVACILFCV
jgi:dopamine beta-monooxygenase